jgi:hypothetical protein
MANTKKNMQKKKNNKILIGAGSILVMFVLIQIVKSLAGGKSTSISIEGNLLIPKNSITTTATFYPYKVGNTKMEVLAVKASDGTIRTAFNTCQVCYSSGRGYYKLDGNTLVCQNCGNRFDPDQVEKEKGGCNPVPIFNENKTDDGQNIVISKEYLQQAKEIFSNWKN